METDATKLVSVCGLANRLKLPAPWLKAEAMAGRIPSLRVGRRLLFNIAAVEAVLLKRAGDRRIRGPTAIAGDGTTAADFGRTARGIAHRERGEP